MGPHRVFSENMLEENEGIRCQRNEIVNTETWQPTPETYINYQSAGYPSGATFSERRFEKSIEYLISSKHQNNSNYGVRMV